MPSNMYEINLDNPKYEDTCQAESKQEAAKIFSERIKVFSPEELMPYIHSENECGLCGDTGKVVKRMPARQEGGEIRDEEVIEDNCPECGFTLAEFVIVAGLMLSFMVLIVVNTVEIGQDIEKELNEVIDKYEQIFEEIEK